MGLHFCTTFHGKSRGELLSNKTALWVHYERGASLATFGSEDQCENDLQIRGIYIVIAEGISLRQAKMTDTFVLFY